MSEDSGSDSIQKSKLENRRYIILAIIAAIAIISVVVVVRFSDDIFGAPSPYPGVGKLGSDHQHARFRVYLDGKRFSFIDWDNHYKKSEYIFLENRDGNLIHRFATGATLGMFFESIGMKFNSTCFITDKPFKTQFVNSTEFCNDGNRTLKFYVNDQLNDSYDKYVLMENDRILITYGNQTQKKIDNQLRTLKPIPIPPGLVP